jgi:hypothetical protein
MSFFLSGLVLAAVFAGSPIEVTGEPTNPGLGTTFPNPQPPAPFPIPPLPSPYRFGNWTERPFQDNIRIAAVGVLHYPKRPTGFLGTSVN